MSDEATLSSKETQPRLEGGGASTKRPLPIPIESGMMVTEDLQLEQQLGTGGMATVWVAYNSKLDTRVAVKFIQDHLARSKPESLERFQREARIAAQLTSPHVVRIMSFGALADGTPYLTMELLRGHSLQQYLARHRVLSPKQTMLMVSQTARVLEEAHELDIIHRDIKPANLFLQETRYDIFVKLLDFGIAKQMQVSELSTAPDITIAGSLLGSPRYMSPEQLSNEADWRADLWSLAAVTYHCLVGKSPFDGADLMYVAHNIRARKYPPVTSLDESLPAGLDDWFAKAFHQKIDERFQSAEEMVSSLHEAFDSSPPSGYPNAPPSETLRLGGMRSSKEQVESAVRETRARLLDTPPDDSVSSTGNTLPPTPMRSVNVPLLLGGGLILLGLLTFFLTMYRPSKDGVAPTPSSSVSVQQPRPGPTAAPATTATASPSALSSSEATASPSASASVSSAAKKATPPSTSRPAPRSSAAPVPVPPEPTLDELLDSRD